MADDKIIVKIELDDGSIKQGFINIERQAADTAGNIGKGFSKGGSGLSGLSAGVVALGSTLAAIGVSAFAFKKAMGAAIGEAVQGEEAINRLSSALSLQGKFSKEAIDGFTSYAEKLSTLTGIDDDLIVSNAGLLASLGNLSGEGLERASKAALDLSTASGKDLEGVTQALAKAANGSTEALGRYGIKLDESIPKSQRFETALKLIETRFGGLAESRTNTFSGALDLISLSVDNVLKAFGNLIVQSPAVRGFLKTLGELISTVATNVAEFFKGKDPFGDLLKSIAKFAVYFTQYFLPPIEIFFNFFKTGLLTIVTFRTGVIMAFAQIVNFFIQNVALPVINFFTVTLASVIAPFSKETADKLINIGSDLTQGLKIASSKAAEVTKEIFEGSANALIDSTGSVLDTKISNAANKTALKFQESINSTANNVKLPQPGPAKGAQPVPDAIGVSEGFKSAIDGADSAMENFTKNAQAGFAQVGAQMFNVLGTGAANAFASFGKAIAKGQNGLKAFVGAIVSAFGQTAVMIGTQFILLGTAYAFSGVPAYIAQAPGLIAAGAALAAFGGILSAMGEGGGASAGAGASGPAVQSGGFETPINPELGGSLDRTQNQNQVIINGDVFDSDGTGQRIVNLLRDFSDKNGQVLV